jgi:hypothetical protein
MIQITATIHEEDVGLLYAILASYHSNPDIFKERAKILMDGQAETTTSSPQPSQGPEMNLYKKVLNECNCGECYEHLARDDRIPWRWEPACRQFVNAKHGFYKPSGECSLSFTDYEYSGWIFRQICYSLSQAKASVVAQRAKLEEVRVRTEVAEKATAARLAEEQFRHKTAELERKQQRIDAALDRMDALDGEIHHHASDVKASQRERIAENLKKGNVRSVVKSSTAGPKNGSRASANRTGARPQAAIEAPKSWRKKEERTRELTAYDDQAAANHRRILETMDTQRAREAYMRVSRVTAMGYPDNS